MVTSPNAGPDSLEELKEFLGFLRNLWAILAGVSVFFPLSNVLAQLIPLAKLDEGGLAYLSPTLVTTISTVGCLFVILWTFVQRGQYVQEKRAIVRRLAGLSFAGGVVALILYLAVNFAIVEGFYWNSLGWESADARRILGDIVLLFAYTGFFALMTRAFLLLGLLEYFRSRGGVRSS